MPRLVKAISLSFDDYICKKTSSKSSLPLGLRLDKQQIDTTYSFSNYSYFLTISMKNDFCSAESFYRAIKQYLKFIKNNNLCEAIDCHFEYYKTHDKLHCHALIDWHTDKQMLSFKKWTREYFKVVHAVTLSKFNFDLYKICVKHKIPNVEITKKYLYKDRDMMTKLNFTSISFWLKSFVECVKNIRVKKNTTDKSQSVKELQILQLASEIHGDLHQYNSLKKTFKINI
eukprot:COSAG06_NODE_8756_length_2077_cov_42139.928716_2_plen_229_part_00